MTSVTHGDTGVNVVETAAIAGNADAQYKLGLMYLLGEGVERDYTQALQWFDMAATQGLTKALYGLLQLPLQWFKSAAIQGNILAQYYLGVMYCHGENVQQDYPLVALHLNSDEAIELDYAQALQWYSKAATQGEGRAYLALGWMYFQGKGVAKDYAQALQDYANAAVHGYIAQNELDLLGTIQQAEAGDIAAQYSLGLLYYKGKAIEHDYKQALQWFHKAAEQDHADAQFNVGEMYYRGHGIKQNVTKALQWLQSAAFQNHASAQFKLGELYSWGKGVEKNAMQALQWIEKAAAQGSADAQFTLGIMYRKGEEVSLDHVQAVRWLLKAADQGHTQAQYALWWLYRKGKGVERDFTQALYWLKQAATQGYGDAQNTLGVMYRRGCGVAQDYGKALYWFYQRANQWSSYPARVAERNYLRLSVKDYVERGLIDQENSFVQYYFGLLNSENNYDHSAAEWYAKAAAQGHAQAQSELGWLYYRGDGVDQDYQQALLWFEQAAVQGVIEEPDMLDKLKAIQHAFDGVAAAQYTLGLMYRFDYLDAWDGDNEQAFAWFEKAALQGHAKAQYAVGNFYYHERHDIDQAQHWFRQAAAKDVAAAQAMLDWFDTARNVPKDALAGDVAAQFKLGLMYRNGDYVLQDYVQAMEWFTQAASQKHIAAYRELGDMYFSGYGVKNDKGQALQWFRKAALRGDATAQVKLGRIYRADKDYAQALHWLKQAAAQKDADALYTLGWMFNWGEGVKLDKEQAWMWFERAAAQGHKEAQLSCETRRKQITGMSDQEKHTTSP